MKDKRVNSALTSDNMIVRKPGPQKVKRKLGKAASSKKQKQFIRKR